MADALGKELEAAAARLQDAREHLIIVMRRAREAGWSYRDIAERVGMSHETVRAMTSKRPES